MKRRTVRGLFLLCMVLMFTLVGCGPEKEKKDTSYQKIKDKGELILGFDDNYPPMGFTTADGSYTGFDIDMAKEVCKRLNLKLKLQPIMWDEKEKDLEDGTIDCVWCGLSVNEERRASMTLSGMYMDNEQIFVVNKGSSYKSVKDLEGKIVGTQSGSSTETTLKSATNLPKFELITEKEYVDLFQMMEEGKIDSVFIDSVLAYYYISENNKQYYVLPAVFDTEGFAIGFRKGDESLRDEIQKTLSEMRADGTLAKISTEWFGTDVTTVQ